MLDRIKRIVVWTNRTTGGVFMGYRIRMRHSPPASKHPPHVVRVVHRRAAYQRCGVVSIEPTRVRTCCGRRR